MPTSFIPKGLSILPHLGHLLIVAAIVLCSRQAFAQLPSQGVVFDDFRYTSAQWCRELDGCTPNSGSVFGYNTWRTSVGGATATRRAWYLDMWQEMPLPSGASLSIVTNEHLRFSIAAGTYGSALSPQPQIMSGLTARRGTWAARVNFGDMETAAVADLFQSFWTYSPYVAWRNNERRWNEIDFEWNNRFNGTSQQFPYLATGHTDGSSASINTLRPLFAPPWPDGVGGTPVNYQWNCKFVWGNYEDVRLLTGQECSDILRQRTVYGHTPLYDPGIVLLMQVTEDAIFYEIASDGWGGVIVAHSVRQGPTTNIPMAAFFSHYMGGASTLNASSNFDIDWFYYSPSTTVSINDVNQQVWYLRNTLGIPRFNNTGLDIQRPTQYLQGEACTYLPNLTTPPTPSFVYPSSMVRGSTTTLVALPPRRLGFGEYTSWKYRTITSSGPSTQWMLITPDKGGWEASFTFPNSSSVVGVEVSVTLAELYNPGNPTQIVNCGPIAGPVEGRFTISASSLSPRVFQASTDEALRVRSQANEPGSPEQIILSANYPNPFNPTTSIRFALPHASHVQIIVSDVLGRQVATLADEEFDAGYHDVSWDAGHLPSGTYLYQLRADGVVQTRLMNLVK